MAAFQYAVELYVPLQSCPCNFQHTIDEIFALLLPYKEFVDFAVKDAGSKQADELNIIGTTVLVRDLKDNKELLRTQRTAKLKTFCSEVFEAIKNSGTQQKNE
jgi:hypothetical protein